MSSFDNSKLKNMATKVNDLTTRINSVKRSFISEEIVDNEGNVTYIPSEYQEFDITPLWDDLTEEEIYNIYGEGNYIYIPPNTYNSKGLRIRGFSATTQNHINAISEKKNVLTSGGIQYINNIICHETHMPSENVFDFTLNYDSPSLGYYGTIFLDVNDEGYYDDCGRWVETGSEETRAAFMLEFDVPNELILRLDVSLRSEGPYDYAFISNPHSDFSQKVREGFYGTEKAGSAIENSDGFIIFGAETTFNKQIFMKVSPEKKYISFSYFKDSSVSYDDTLSVYIMTNSLSETTI